MALFDSHCHLDVEAFDGDRSAVIERATTAGVRRILIPAIRPSTWAALTVVIGQHPGRGLLAALGVHPQIVPDLSPAERALAMDAERLAAAAATAGAVAIGECGLDGGTAQKEQQEAIFRAHIRAARAAKLPLVVHVLRAHDRAQAILAEEGAAHAGGVLHSYSGGAGLIGRYRDLGMAFSLAGPVTWPNARRPVEAARAIPDDLLLAETDAPDQAPQPHRGARCEPAFLYDVIAGLAAARQASPATLAALTHANACRLFHQPLQ